MGPLEFREFLYPEYDFEVCKNFITSSFWSGATHIKISERPIYYFWSNPEHKQTDRQINDPTETHKLLVEVIIWSK